jgi:glutathione S-transferase
MLRRMPLKLYGHDTSPYVRRVRVLLAEKGLDFTRDTDSWSTPDAEVMRINPLLRVPALVDEDAKTALGSAQHLLDSKLIATYLYDRFPQVASIAEPPLLSTLFHPQHRYDDENLLHAIDAATDSAINLFLLELDGVQREKVPYLQRQAERMRRCLSWLDDQLAGRTTFHDGSFAFIDIALICALDWFLFRNRYPVLEHKHLAKFLDAHRRRETVAATHPSLAKNTAPPRTSPAK